MRCALRSVAARPAGTWYTEHVKRSLLIGFSILAVAAIIVGIGAILGAEREGSSWLCRDGVWVAYGNPTSAKPSTPCGTASAPLWSGDVTVLIEDDSVALRNGVATEPLAPGSAALRTVKVWSVSASGDLNGDGKPDVALVLTDERGGSGTFYYLVAALSLPSGGFQGTNAIFMGDRVAPQNVAIEDGRAVTNYADRAPDEPFSARPSIGKTLRAMVIGGVLLTDSTREHLDRIRVEMPQPGGRITSPLAVKGAARGTWYFEASFPVELRAYDGTVLAQVPAQAQGEWMTEEFVPFSVTLTFPAQPAGSTGVLILHKDNPSGEARFDDRVVLPVLF